MYRSAGALRRPSTHLLKFRAVGEPNVLAYLVMGAFIPFTLASFAAFPSRKAVLVSLMTGWLLLPAAGVYVIPPLRTKEGFICGVIFLASLLFDSASWRGSRLRWLDLPVTVLSLVPFATAIANEMEAPETLSATMAGVTTYGVPYLLGRAYFGDLGSLRDFAKALVVAGAAYVPLCLFEIRMSPNLHNWLYGFGTFQFLQAVRGGGYRPTVFMVHGLMLALFMVSATLVAYWMWRTRSPTRLLGVPIGWVALGLAITSLLLRSAGAQILLVAGILALETTRLLRSSLLVVALLVLPGAYCATRTAGWQPGQVVDFVSEAISLERADSFQFRVRNENLLIEKALQRPVLGWGRWGRNLVYDDSGRSVTTTDGLWILALGMTGILGLAALVLTFSLPVAAFIRRFPAVRWSDPRLSSAAALAVTVLLWLADSVPNAMMNPLFTVIAGGLTGVVVGRAKAASNERPRAPRPTSRAAHRANRPTAAGGA